MPILKSRKTYRPNNGIQSNMKSSVLYGILFIILSSHYSCIDDVNAIYKLKTTRLVEKKLKIESLLIDQDGRNSLIHGKNRNRCIDRMQFQDQLLNFFDIDYDVERRTIIIFGCLTELGKWFTSHYKEKDKYSLLLIRGIFDFDFQNPTTMKLLSKLKIKRMIICYAPDFESFHSIQNMKNLNSRIFKSIANIVGALSIETCFFSYPPFFEEKYIYFKSSLVTIFLMPYIISDEIIALTNILDQKILRLYINNSKYQTKINEYDDYYLLSCSYYSLIPKLMKYKSETKFVVIESDNMIKLSEFLSYKFNEKEKYNYKFVNSLSNYSRYQLDSKNQDKIQYNDEFVRKMAIYKQYKSDHCYIEIMVATRNDNYGKDMYHRLGVFIQSINDGLDMFPSAKIGLHIVDYNSPNDNYLYKDIGFPKKILNSTRTTIISQKQHEYINKHIGGKIKIYEYIAKNIGMTYSTAEFILNTNLDEIYPPLLFEAIALQHFSPNYLYKARRIDQKQYIYYGTENYKHLFDVVDNDFINFNKIQYNLFENPSFTNPGDFQMASKRFFELIHGFSEYPQNMGMDDLIIWSTHRFLTLGVEFETGIDFFHQYHTKPQKINENFFQQIGNQLKCKGFTELYNFNKYNGPHWGFKNLTFKHIKIADIHYL